MKRIIAMMAAALLLMMSLTACGGSNESEEPVPVDLSAVMSEIESAYQLPEMLVLSSAADLISRYGIAEEDVAQFVAQINSSGVEQDEIVLIEAVDSKAAVRIESMLQNRYDSKLSQMENYLPEQYDIIKACSVETNGNFVSMIVSPDAAGMNEIYHSYVN